MHYEFDKLQKSNKEFQEAVSAMEPKTYAAWPDDDPPLNSGTRSKPKVGTPLLLEAVENQTSGIVTPKDPLPFRIISARHPKKDAAEAGEFQRMIESSLVPLVKTNRHTNTPKVLLDILCNNAFGVKCDQLADEDLKLN